MIPGTAGNPATSPDRSVLENAMGPRHFRFVGGSQDGRALPVPEPIRTDMEFLVRPAEPYLPWEPYQLGDDGQFHYRGLHAVEPDASVAEALHLHG